VGRPRVRGPATALLAGQPLPDWAEGLVHPDDVVKATSKPARK
jgi:hypothetical protein